MDIDGWPPAPEAPAEAQPQLLAVDTNVLINRLPLVQALHKRLLASDMWLFVPHVVVRELDHQKTSARPEVRRAAQAASAWLRDALKLARHTHVRVRLESLPEYRAAQPYEPGLELKNDERILRSLMACAAGTGAGGATPGGGAEGGAARGLRVRLWTEDVNFALMAEAAGLGTLGKCVALSGVLGALGLEDMDEGMELDVEPGVGVDVGAGVGAGDLFVRPQPVTGTGTPHATPAASAAASRTGTPQRAKAGGGVPPPGALRAAIARMRSPCPAPLRPAILAALAAFAERLRLPLAVAGPGAVPPPVDRPGSPDAAADAEAYFDACAGAVQQLTAAVDASALPLRTQGELGAALRTLGRFVGPRAPRAPRLDEVRAAIVTLSEHGGRGGGAGGGDERERGDGGERGDGDRGKEGGGDGGRDGGRDEWAPVIAALDAMQRAA